MANDFRLYGGLEAGIPVLADRQPGFTTDTFKLFIGFGGVNYEIGSSTPSGSAGGDLGGTYPNPDVVGLNGDALPSNIADGFLKRNAGNAAWEQVPYGNTSNTVCEGSDSRLSDNRTPTAHASTHEPDGTDEIDWTGVIHRIGIDASKPAAGATNAGTYYTSTDVNGGTTYRSNGSTWVQIAGAVTPTGGETVTSVGLSTNATWLTVASSPVTTSGTITINKTTGQTANRFLATPNGSTGVVDLRSIVEADIPTGYNSFYDTYANIGYVSPSTGSLYFSSDEGCPYVFRYNGSTWDAFINNFCVKRTASVGGWIDQNGGNVDVTYGDQIISDSANASTHSLVTRGAALPSAPYKLIIGISTNPTVQYAYNFVGWKNNTNGLYQGILFGSSDATGVWLYSANFNSSTSLNAATGSINIPGAEGNYLWLMLVDDNTNREIWVSSTRTVASASLHQYSWTKVFTATRTNFVTPDRWVVGVDPYSRAASLRFVDFEDIT